MRVVVTGLGIISPLGKSIDVFWKSILAGKSGISFLNFGMTDSLKCHFAGRIENTVLDQYFSVKDCRRMDRFCQLAVYAAEQAWQDSGRTAIQNSREKTGVIFGTGIGGISTWDHPIPPESDSDETIPFNAFTIPRIMNNAPAAQTAIRLGLTGQNLTINTACSAGANAIGMGFREVQSGNHDAMICGGTEAPVTPKILKAWEILGVLTKEGSVTPFDRNRSGFVLAEGAGAVVLESLVSAQKNNRMIYAEIIGYGSNCDAHHLTAPEEKGQAEAIESALKDAGISITEIDYINAHGTATKINDRIETAAIKNVFKNNACKIPISSTKSMIGHAMGASSAIELIVTALSVKHNMIHPTRNYKEPDPQCDLDYVPGKAREKTINHALSNSFGFGGSNSVLVVKKWKN